MNKNYWKVFVFLPVGLKSREADMQVKEPC